MTITNLPPDRPIPDADDLRLLTELINNVAIPLANAAWNARMSQAEAAARLVSMAERGLPLRLVADGDRNALWHIAQAGPAPTSAEHHGDDVASGDSASERPGPVEAGPPLGPSAEPGHAEPRWARYPVTGPAGEQLMVTISEVRDPSDDVLAASGSPVAPGYRAVLVRSVVSNVGSVYYPASADANLVLETDHHELLGRSGPLPAAHPGFAIGIAPGQAADGWSLFVIPAATRLAGLKWCIRPDIPQTIVSWPLAP